MKQLIEYENELFGAKKQEDVQDAFTLKKRQEIEAEKEMLKNKISIKDKLKAFAPTLEPPSSDEQNRSVSPSTPNRIRDTWKANPANSVDKDSLTPATEERPAPRKLTSILSIFQPKETKENQQPNTNFVKNTAPTRKWKPVEVTTLQGTKGPEVKKGFSYDKVRKSKSKEWKGREVKKTKSKVLSKVDSVQKDEPKVVEKEPVKFAASVTINNPIQKKPTPVEQSNRVQKQESLKQDTTAPWRKPRDADNKISPAKETIVAPKLAETPKPTIVKNEPPRQAPKVPQPPPPPPPSQSVVRQIPIQTQTVQNSVAAKPEQVEVSPQKRVFGRIPPPPMKIIGRDVSLSDDRKITQQPLPQKPAPTPDPQSKVTNITITSSKKESQPLKQETPRGQLVKTITLEESSEEEEEDEEEDEEDEEEDEEEESEDEEEAKRRNSKAGLTRSSTLEILKLIKSKTQALQIDDKPMLNAVDENEEIDTLLGGLEQEGIDNIDWEELGIELDEVKNIVAKNQGQEEEEEEVELEDEEEEDEEEED